jgi:hypothetical protein
MNWSIDELTLSSWREDSKLLKKQASWPSVPMTTVKLRKGRSAQATEIRRSKPRQRCFEIEYTGLNEKTRNEYEARDSYGNRCSSVASRVRKLESRESGQLTHLK